MFETLVKTRPSACERGKTMALAQFRIVDVVRVDAVPARLVREELAA